MLPQHRGGGREGEGGGVKRRTPAFLSGLGNVIMIIDHACPVGQHSVCILLYTPTCLG